MTITRPTCDSFFYSFTNSCLLNDYLVLLYSMVMLFKDLLVFTMQCMHIKIKETCSSSMDKMLERQLDIHNDDVIINYTTKVLLSRTTCLDS